MAGVAVVPKPRAMRRQPCPGVGVDWSGEVTRCLPAAPEGGAACPWDGEAGSDSWAGDVACSQHLRAVFSVREWEDSWA